MMLKARPPGILSLRLMEYEFYLAASRGPLKNFEQLKMKLLDLHFRKFTFMIVVKDELKQLMAELPHFLIFRNVCGVILVATVTGKCHRHLVGKV